jgi:hypothetical protein
MNNKQSSSSSYRLNQVVDRIEKEIESGQFEKRTKQYVKELKHHHDHDQLTQNKHKSNTKKNSILHILNQIDHIQYQLHCVREQVVKYLEEEI